MDEDARPEEEGSDMSILTRDLLLTASGGL